MSVKDNWIAIFANNTLFYVNSEDLRFCSSTRDIVNTLLELRNKSTRHGSVSLQVPSLGNLDQ